MPKKKMYVEWDDGTDLSHSQKRPGEHSPLIRDADGNLVGHAVLSDIDDDDDDDDYGLYAGDPQPSPADDDDLTVGEALAALALLVAIVEAAPHVSRWWNDHALPAIQATKASTRRQLAKVRRPRHRSVTRDIAVADDAAIPLPAVTPDATPAEEGAVLTTDEAQQLRLAALAARAFSDEQIRVLLNARIEDVDRALDAKQALVGRAPAEIEAQVRYLLEANPGALEEFLKVFAEGRHRLPALVQRTTGDASRQLPGTNGGSSS